MNDLRNHELAPDHTFRHIRYETRPVLDRQGNPVEGLHQVWIWLDNPAQLNSYTTEMTKEVILGFRRASADRRAVAVVFTGTGERSFCTGGNTEEYATYYAGRPHEYLQYMRLFNDMVTSILLCDKPVICRVNGMRVAGGQEIGMACDFSVAGDNASFGQAGPIHGSAPDGGSTDFLHLYVGFSKAAESLALCTQWSAYMAHRLGLINDVVPVYRDGAGHTVPNPLVETGSWIDATGQVVFGAWKGGEEKARAKERLKELTIDLTALDAKIDEYVTTLLHTFPDCTRKTLEGLRKKKLEHWYANSETNRSWLSLNMATEASAGFPAFHYGQRGKRGERDGRQIDFAALRRGVADGRRFDRGLVLEVLSPSARQGVEDAARQQERDAEPVLEGAR